MKARRVRGRDMNDWIPDVDELLADREYGELEPLLNELMAADEDYAYHSMLPPQSYWHERAFRVYRELGYYQLCATIAERWLSLPDTDLVPGRLRQMLKRLERAHELQAAADRRQEQLRAKRPPTGP